MYMDKNKKIIIICKFNLKNKCKFGEKCKFRHLNLSELSDILNKFESLKNENESLKLDLKEKYQKISNLEKKYGDVTNLEKTSQKPLYNSLFKEKIDKPEDSGIASDNDWIKVENKSRKKVEKLNVYKSNDCIKSVQKNGELLSQNELNY